jgi:hypothetical protein
MTTTQRPRPPRQAPPGPNPASRGLILVVVAVLLGAILLFKGGGIGSQTDATDIEIGSGGGGGGETTESTITAPTTPSSSVAPAALQVVVLNAAGENGFAAKGAAFLNLAGYPNVGAETAAAPATTTTVYFAPGYEGDAQAIAGLLSVGTVQPLPDPATLGKAAADVPPTTNVVVALGPDVKPVIDAATTPTTTAAPAGGSTGGAATPSTIPAAGGNQTTTTKG